MYVSKGLYSLFFFFLGYIDYYFFLKKKKLIKKLNTQKVKEKVIILIKVKY